LVSQTVTGTVCQILPMLAQTQVIKDIVLMALAVQVRHRRHPRLLSLQLHHYRHHPLRLRHPLRHQTQIAMGMVCQMTAIIAQTEAMNMGMVLMVLDVQFYPLRQLRVPLLLTVVQNSPVSSQMDVLSPPYVMSHF